MDPNGDDVGNQGLTRMTACVEIRLPGRVSYATLRSHDPSVWKRWADDVAGMETPGSTLAGASAYAKGRFNARLQARAPDGEPPMSGSAALLMDARESEGEGAAERFAASLLKEAGFWVAEAPSFKPPRESAIPVMELLRSLALHPPARATALIHRGEAVQALFERDGASPGIWAGSDRNAYLVRSALDKGVDPAWMDFSGRGADNKPYQGIADLIALALLSQTTIEDGFAKTTGAYNQDNSRARLFQRAALLIKEAEPPRELPRFDGRERFPELDWRPGCEGSWNKPELAGLDLLDALLCPELLERYGHVDANDHADLVEWAVSGADLAPGRGAKALRDLLIKGGLVQGASRGAPFGARRLTGVALALARADPCFDMADIGLDRQGLGGSKRESLRFHLPELAAALERESERAAVARAAGPGLSAAPKPRL